MYSTKTTLHKSASVPILLVYIVFVCTLSGLGDFFVWPHITPLVAKNPILILIEPAWKLIYWHLPALLYIKYVEKQNPLTYLKLNRRIGWGILWGGIISLLVVVVILCNKYLLLHQPFHTRSLTLNEWVNIVLLVGFLEEIPFRGFLFQKLQLSLGFWWGAILAGLIFLELHLVFWISLGKSPTYLLNGAPSIFIFALVSCALLKRTGSLWSSIVLHSIYDFTSIFFV